MQTKLFEVRDRGTFIPVMATLISPSHEDSSPAEFYLMRRAGFGVGNPLVGNPLIILCRLECSGVARNATYDPFAWGANSTRTLTVAHQHIAEHWAELETGAVIDVEFILGETREPKRSEAFSTHVPGEEIPES